VHGETHFDASAGNSGDGEWWTIKFLIIGADAAGLSAARRAKRILPEMEVIDLELAEDGSYSICRMLYGIADPAGASDQPGRLGCGEHRLRQCVKERSLE
jgi:hypothetical protein